MKKLKILATASALIMSASAAQAQSMDYSSLEMLFGEPVTTSANGTPQRISEVPLNMEIITAEDIKKKAARNIADILRGVSGISVFETNVGGYDIGFRGMNQATAEKILVLVNGRQVYIDTYGFVNWSLIPVQLAEIQQIEIVKGPNTALFGFNAVSGVINILTKNPLHNELGEVSASYGNQDYLAASYAQIFKPMENMGLRVSAGGFQSEDNDEGSLTAAEAAIRNGEPKNRQFAADALWKVGNNTELGLEITHAESSLNKVSIGSPQSSHQKMNSVKVSLVSDTDYGLVELKAYHNMTDMNYRFTTFAFENENRVTVVSASDTFKVGTDHKLRLSTEYRHNSSLMIPGDNGAETEYDIFSGAGLWDWAISDKWNLSSAVRVDHVDLNKSDDNLASFGFGGNPFTDYDEKLTEYAYNLGLVYKMSDYDTIRVMAARGIDLPSLLEFGAQLSVFGGAAGVYGNPKTEASVVTNYELGYDRQIEAIDGLARFAAYYQHFDEAQNLTANTTGFGSVFSTDNVGDVFTYGIEAGLGGTSDAGLEWDVAYNYQHPENDYAVGKSGVDFEEANPRHVANLQLGYAFNDKLRLDGLAQYSSKYKQGTAEYGDSTLVNAKLSYQAADNVTLSLNTIGALEEVREEAFGADVERSVWAQVNVQF